MNIQKKLKKQAVLLCTDKDSPLINIQYNALKKATIEYADVFIVFHAKETCIPSFIHNTDHYLFSNSVLTELGYSPIGGSLLPGNNHFQLLKFYRENPEYEYYWVIEDDVRFSGDWELFFNSFLTIPSDFITCCIRHWVEEPGWFWWKLEHHFKEVPLEKRLRSFNPIYRISNLALQFINMVLLDGWCGHHEVLLPTLLKYGGYQVADFGGDSKYVLPGFENKFYISSKPNSRGILSDGTMKFRPIFNIIGSEPDKIYHPVKDFYTEEGTLRV